MRNRLSILAVVIILAAAAGCSRPVQEPEPQAALTGYLEALVGGNTEEAAKFLSARAPSQAGAKAKDPGSFEAKMVRRALASHVSFDIAIVEKSGEKARLRAKIKSPDFPRIARDITARLAAAQFPAGGIDSLDYTAEIVNSLIRTYREKGLPMTSMLRNYELVKEGGEWKISGWD